MSGRRRTRPLLALTLSLATAVALVGVAAGPSGAVAASAVTAATGPAVPVLDWQPCTSPVPGAEIDPRLECATATVPLDYRRAAAGTTSVALARLPATDTAGRVGSVFVNPGGPGGSGVDLVLGGFGDELSPGLAGKFDVVGFDPRGVGASDPLRCFSTAEEQGSFGADLPVFPYLRTQEKPFFETLRSLGRTCVAEGGAIARYMSTANVARDLDLLRRAVGDEKLTYLGFSYGSILGTTYANLFPKNVRALAIDGVIDPNQWTGGWQIRSNRVSTEQEFQEFLRLCDEVPGNCLLSAPGGAEARFDALAARLRAEPVVIGEGEDSLTYTYDVLISDALSAMYAPELWSTFGFVFGAVANAVLDDVPLPSAERSLSKASTLRRSAAARLSATHAVEDEVYDNGQEAYYGVICNDASFPRLFQSFRAIGDYAARGSRFGPLWWWDNAVCADWPAANDRYFGPWQAKTSAPVLVVGNQFDGITPLSAAVQTDRLLRNSVLLTYAGWGHTAYGRSACTTAYIHAYLLDVTVPSTGTVCSANPNPFLTPVTVETATTGSGLSVGLPAASYVARAAAR